MERICLKCGGTGVLVSGELCDCGCTQELQLPTMLKVPIQYQGVRFDKGLVRSDLGSSYASYLDGIVRDITSSVLTFNKNICICSPPNSSKSVLAYTIYGLLFAKGYEIPKLMDIMEIRPVMMSLYSNDASLVTLISSAPVMFVKLPMDTPPRMAETMSMLIERRVRNNASTIFLYSGTKDDMFAQDTFGKLKQLSGDGSYNSIEFKSWRVEDDY